MKDQADKNTSQLNSLLQLYYVINSKLSFNSNTSINPSIKFCENMLNEIYKKHSKDKNSKSTKLTIINADNKELLADCDIFKDSIIELSADEQAILIKQKTLNENTEWILICLSEGKVIVSKTVPKICNIISDKNFDFQCWECCELMNCNNNILDKKNEENDCKNLNQNKNELSNNSNIYKEKEPENKEKEHEDKKNIINNVSQNELENDLKNEISVEKYNQNMDNIENIHEDNINNSRVSNEIKINNKNVNNAHQNQQDSDMMKTVTKMQTKKRHEKQNILNGISSQNNNYEIMYKKEHNNTNKKLMKKVNFNDKINIINVESFKKLNYALANNDDNDKEEKNDKERNNKENISQVVIEKHRYAQPLQWSSICGLDLSCLDCCHCFCGQQSV